MAGLPGLETGFGGASGRVLHLVNWAADKDVSPTARPPVSDDL